MSDTLRLVDNPEEDLGFTDTDNAERLWRLHRDKLRYVHAFATFLVWEGTRWKRDPRGVYAAELAKDIHRDLYQQISEMVEEGAHVDDVKRLTRWAEQSASRTRIDAAVYLARGMDGILIASSARPDVPDSTADRQPPKCAGR